MAQDPRQQIPPEILAQLEQQQALPPEGLPPELMEQMGGMHPALMGQQPPPEPPGPEMVLQALTMKMLETLQSEDLAKDVQANTVNVFATAFKTMMEVLTNDPQQQMQIEMAKAEMEMQMKQQEMQLKAEEHQMNMQFKQQENSLKLEQAQQQAQFKQFEQAQNLQQKQIEGEQKLEMNERAFKQKKAQADSTKEKQTGEA